MAQFISGCCGAAIDTDYEICSDCKDHCDVITVEDCCGCPDVCYSDTWTKDGENLYCEECAKRILLK